MRCRPAGSSPRVWGALHNIQRQRRTRRLIPTCVGSTVYGIVDVRPQAAHPHVCGEHFWRGWLVRNGCGSSPRVWGARPTRKSPQQGRRLIPTCVGSTQFVHGHRKGLEAHPHVCGEHRWHRHQCLRARGSSPRVWGALADLIEWATENRLIPTCVGSTPQLPLVRDRSPAHPHVCGEHGAMRGMRAPVSGSSPRVWGALGDTVTADGKTRLIPTCVGSTHRIRNPCPPFSAHPHVCGEHSGAGDWRNIRGGSSPRVWGALVHLRHRNQRERLIPTCVGSTGARPVRTAAKTAHPHVCGEHMGTGHRFLIASGSSPRVWGALVGRLVESDTLRLIPTCVGST